MNTNEDIVKAVILAGGLGTRISEESHLRPKPMIEIGGFPILWHIMKHYSHYGINHFVICCGYKASVIKEYFINYHYNCSNISIDLKANSIRTLSDVNENWQITLVDTGAETQTGGRIGRIKDFVGNTFCLTYGDGVANININELIQFHRNEGRTCTVTAVQPAGRFGALQLENNRVSNFEEKPAGDRGWVNGGFFVCDRSVFEFIKGDATIWEQEPLTSLAENHELSAFKHEGFWMAMDTLRDKNALEDLWQSDDAPWKVWD